MIRWGNGKSGAGGASLKAEAHRVMASVRDLSWEGYHSLIADIFRRRGHDVFAGEGPDQDVIDMEMAAGDRKVIVNCQLRGMRHISVAPLEEMALVAERNGAASVLLITDGDFSPEARSYASDHSLVLVDGEALLELVMELTFGDEREQRIGARLAKLFKRGGAN
jgi:restriction system protein